MNFIQFTGHRKTTDHLLDSIRAISANDKSLLDNLASLNIFSSCTPTKRNKIALDETPNTFRMRVTSKGGKSMLASFPNIFGGGEFLNANIKDLSDIVVEVGKPLFIKDQIVHTKISVGRNKRKINNKAIETRKIELETRLGGVQIRSGFEKIQKLDVLYSQLITRIMGVKVDSKVGVTKTDRCVPFLKIAGGRKWGLHGTHTFAETGLMLGKIFGQTSVVEKFFLGDTLRGYKRESIGPVSQNTKIGGNSFVEIRSRAGVFVKGLEVFVFGDVGVNSVKGIRECGEILASFGNNNCIGKSVGIGFGTKNKTAPSFIFAVPLTSNPDAEKYVIGVDFEF